jgi:dTDP-4-amino-4,6-dideoxygalactose transaminase
MSRSIPISKPHVGEEEKKAVLEVLESGMLAQGPKVAALEASFARTVGTRFAVATSSGTTALHLALLANGIGPGDEVITSAFTFIASINSILFVGARPVFCDIDGDTFNLDVAKLESLVSSKTRAIMPVHLYGQPCTMDVICDVARRRGLVVVEDAAQAIGATFRGKQAGSFGTGCFSLYATKNIMAGEGGMITTDDERVAELCRSLRQHGSNRRYYHDMLGYNFRMTDLCAAIGVVQLRRLDQVTAVRRRNAAALSARIRAARVPVCAPDREHVWHQYTVRIAGGEKAREHAVAKLTEAGIGCGVFYPVPAHRQAHVRAAGYGNVDLPVTERASQEVLSLPVHPDVSEEDVEFIAREVNRL